MPDPTQQRKLRTSRAAVDISDGFWVGGRPRATQFWVSGVGSQFGARPQERASRSGGCGQRVAGWRLGRGFRASDARARLTSVCRSGGGDQRAAGRWPRCEVHVGDAEVGLAYVSRGSGGSQSVAGRWLGRGFRAGDVEVRLAPVSGSGGGDQRVAGWWLKREFPAGDAEVGRARVSRVRDGSQPADGSWLGRGFRAGDVEVASVSPVSGRNQFAAGRWLKPEFRADGVGWSPDGRRLRRDQCGADTRHQWSRGGHRHDAGGCRGQERRPEKWGHLACASGGGPHSGAQLPGSEFRADEGCRWPGYVACADGDRWLVGRVRAGDAEARPASTGGLGLPSDGWWLL